MSILGFILSSIMVCVSTLVACVMALHLVSLAGFSAPVATAAGIFVLCVILPLSVVQLSD